MNEVPPEIEMIILSFACFETTLTAHLVCRKWNIYLKSSYVGNSIWFNHYRNIYPPPTSLGQEALMEVCSREKHNHKFWRDTFFRTKRFPNSMKCIFEKQAFNSAYDEAWMGSWSNSKYFSVCSKNGHVVVWEVVKGECDEKESKITEHSEFHLGNDELHPCVFSPSSKYVVVTSDKGKSLFVINLKKKKVCRIRQIGRRIGHSIWMDDERILLGSTRTTCFGSTMYQQLQVALINTDGSIKGIQVFQVKFKDASCDTKKNTFFSPLGRWKDEILFRRNKKVVGIPISNFEPKDCKDSKKLENQENRVLPFQYIEQENFYDVLDSIEGHTRFHVSSSQINDDHLIMNVKLLEPNKHSLQWPKETVLVDFDLAKKKVVQVAKGHVSENTSWIQCDARANIMTSSSMCKSLLFWDRRFGNLLLKIDEAHGISSNGSHISPDCKWVLSYGDDGVVKVYNLPEL